MTFINRRARLWALAAVLALVAGACTSGGSADSAAPTSIAAPGETAPTSTESGSAAVPVQGSLSDYDLSSLSVRVGSKNFIEQEVLGHIFIEALAAAGADASDATNLGNTSAVRSALVAGDIDLYPEYNGTCWTVHLARQDPSSDGEQLTEDCREADEGNGVAWLGRAPLNDTYGLAAGAEFTAENGELDLQGAADFLEADPDANICLGPEFGQRPDGLALFEAATGYTVPTDQIVLLDNASIYRETAASRCDFGVVFTTDGRIGELELTLVEDSGVFITYNPSMSIRGELVEANPAVAEVAELILEPLDDETIIELNRRVAVDQELPRTVALDYLASQGFIAAAPQATAPEETETVAMDAGPLAAQAIILQLQEDLTELGYYDGPLDAVYGTATEEAVLAFQESVVTLAADGDFGPRTAGVIGAILGRDDRESVRAMQEALLELGFYSGAFDGEYGASTAEAVAALQREAGLEPDGSYNAETAEALVAIYQERRPDPESIVEPEAPDDKPPSETTPVEGLLERGSEGPEVEALQERLEELGYRPGISDGTYGDATAAAVMAFQKREGLDRDGQAGPAVMAALQNPIGPGPRAGGPVPRIEVDIVRQVAFIVLTEDDVTTINVSTGNDKPYIDSNGNEAIAYTPVGDYQIERRIEGIREAPLGSLYKPLYFLQGWAIHGSANVPGYPASHGCVRTHNWDQDWVTIRVEDGIPVIVYDELRDSDEETPDDAGAGF